MKHILKSFLKHIVNSVGVETQEEIFIAILKNIADRTGSDIDNKILDIILDKKKENDKC